MSFDAIRSVATGVAASSQSLSSRAMSFDAIIIYVYIGDLLCLNPFRAGRCLSTDYQNSKTTALRRLNPFRAGRCLSTK